MQALSRLTAHLPDATNTAGFGPGQINLENTGRDSEEESLPFFCVSYYAVRNPTINGISAYVTKFVTYAKNSLATVNGNLFLVQFKSIIASY